MRMCVRSSFLYSFVEATECSFRDTEVGVLNLRKERIVVLTASKIKLEKVNRISNQFVHIVTTISLKCREKIKNNFISTRLHEILKGDTGGKLRKLIRLSL